MPQSRPVFLNLLQIHFPVSAVVSVGHRASGVLMILLIPALIGGLGMSATPEGYTWLLEFFSLWWVRGFLFVVIWAFAHHFLAGLRFLLIDLDIGVGKAAERRSAWLVHLGAGCAALLYVGGMLL